MTRFDWFLLGMAATLVIFIASSVTAAYYRDEIKHRWPDDATRANCTGDAHWVCMANEQARMLKLPCAKDVPCSYIVFDSAWGRVVEVKP